jgi:cyclopropane fatty-acyl-phospholipid synthase-like methyltransferase
MTEHWDSVFAAKPPWDIARPQPAFLALAQTGAIRGRVLDVGCGTGEHVLMCAAMGLDATGVDLSTIALREAEQKADDRGLTARFVNLDVRQLRELDETYDTVLDSGLFVHVVDDEHDLADFLDGLRSVVIPGGRYFMLSFHEHAGHAGHARGAGHRAITADQIAAVFSDGWRLDSIQPALLDSAADIDRIPAWLTALTRS